MVEDFGSVRRYVFETSMSPKCLSFAHLNLTYISGPVPKPLDAYRKAMHKIPRQTERPSTPKP